LSADHNINNGGYDDDVDDYNDNDDGNSRNAPSVQVNFSVL
jgi:hypothetical protein